jgi:hypothetical protein
MPLEDNKTETPVPNESMHELESQFILRLPSLAAHSLKAAVKSGLIIMSFIIIFINLLNILIQT